MKKFIYLTSFVVMTMMSASCSNDVEDEVIPPQQERKVFKTNMMLNGDKPTFEEKATRAAEEWEDGSKIYLQFAVGKSRVSGMASYDASGAQWTVELYGALNATNDGACEAYYFENPGSVTYSSVTLNKTTAIYADKKASYAFEDNTVTVNASLKPMTGRIRMKGSANQSFIAEGITFYGSYNLDDNLFIKGDTAFKASVAKSGYSDYFYGFFADEENRKLTFHDRANNVSFERVMGENALAEGRSGFIDIPTPTNRSGWTAVRYKDYTVEGVTFRMMKVFNGTKDITGDYFYIGETEVTQELWEAVMQTNPSEVLGEKYPVTNVTRDDCLSFIEKLNSKTDARFALPSEAVWQFAAKGGNLTKGYTYCGSNTAADVAWYSLNSNGQPHEVKLKQPNELGLYDMSGNVAEWTNGLTSWNSAGGLYSYYSYKYYGGYYNSIEYITPTNSDYIKRSLSASEASANNKGEHIGFRLICDETTLTLAH